LFLGFLNEVIKNYDIPPWKCYFANSLFRLSVFIFTPLNGLLIDKKGLKYTLSLTALTLTLGGIMKCFINYSFWFYIFGNGICGIFFTAT